MVRTLAFLVALGLATPAGAQSYTLPNGNFDGQAFQRQGDAYRDAQRMQQQQQFFEWQQQQQQPPARPYDPGCPTCCGPLSNC